MNPIRPTILLADDDRGLVEALSIRLNAAGYHVVSCMDGDDVVEMVWGTNPDVIVLDIYMPAGSGPDAQQILQACGEIESTPVIYITGASPEEIERVRADLKPFSVIRKPFDADELIATVQAALDAFPPAGRLT